ncbi:hypothetical protein PsorP6_019418 [Peronosclerospora sorghi]|nr:hypothetical protein PsorP6_019418 [Peronosclerospora sorghi]
MRSDESDYGAATLSKKLIQHIDASSVLTAYAAATDAKTKDRGNLDLSRCIFEPESKDGDDQRWPLVIRGNIMLFLDRVLSSALNVSRLLRERDNVTMVLDLLREVKPLVGLQGPNDSEKEYIVALAADVRPNPKHLKMRMTTLTMKIAMTKMIEVNMEMTTKSTMTSEIWQKEQSMH